MSSGYMQSDKWGHDTGNQQVIPGGRHPEPPLVSVSNRRVRTDLRKAQLLMVSLGLRADATMEQIKEVVQMITPEEEEVPAIKSLDEKREAVESGTAKPRDQKRWAEGLKPVIQQWRREKPMKMPNTSENKGGSVSFYDAVANDMKTHPGLWGKVPYQTREPRTEPVSRALRQRLDTEGTVEVIQRGQDVWAKFSPAVGND